MIIFIVMAIDFVFIVLDAVRDATVERLWDWWKWHTVKWVSFFGAQALIIYMAIMAKLIPINVISLLIGGLYATICSIAWNLVYRWVRDKQSF